MIQFGPVEPPPILGPDEKPDAAELARLALELLRELAQHDPVIAERMRDEGMDLASPDRSSAQHDPPSQA